MLVPNRAVPMWVINKDGGWEPMRAKEVDGDVVLKGSKLDNYA